MLRNRAQLRRIDGEVAHIEGEGNPGHEKRLHPDGFNHSPFTECNARRQELQRKPAGYQSPGQRDDRPLQSGDVPPPTTAGDGVGSVAKRERGHAEQDSGMVRSQSDSAPPLRGACPCPCHGEHTPPPSHWVFPPFEKNPPFARNSRGIFAQLNATLQCVNAPCGDPNSRQSAPRENAPLFHCMAVAQHRCCCRAKSAQCNPDVRKCHQFDHDAKVVVLMHCGAEKVPLSPLEICLGAW